jgi:hypothetical protein
MYTAAVSYHYHRLADGEKDMLQESDGCTRLKDGK